MGAYEAYCKCRVQHLNLQHSIIVRKYFNPEEYIFADKAYGFERHLLPHKEQQPANSAELSIPRVEVKHAFGVLKAR